MKLKLVSKSEVFNNDRYILDHVFDGNIITNNNYKGLFVLDKTLEIIRNFKFDNTFLATHYYLSGDRTCFLAYNENGFLHYINLIDPLFKPVTLSISDDIILHPWYIWHEDRFIIMDYKGDFFCFNILNNHFFSLVKDSLTKTQLDFFKIISDYKQSVYRLLYYGWKEGIYIYRTNFERHNKISWKNSSKNIDIEFMSPLVDVYRAECVDNLIFLINDESVAFFYLDQEIYRMNVEKEYMTFGARLYKYKGAFYFLLLTTHVRDQRNTIIDFYKIEK